MVMLTHKTVCERVCDCGVKIHSSMQCTRLTHAGGYVCLLSCWSENDDIWPKNILEIINIYPLPNLILPLPDSMSASYLLIQH